MARRKTSGSRSLPRSRKGTCSTTTSVLNENGGNDYWESGVTNPHLVLADLIKIFHPELLPDHELYFYQKLEP